MANLRTTHGPADLVAAKMDMMQQALPQDDYTLSRFKQAAIAVARDPKIADCAPASVAQAIYQCARLGLIPDPVLHHAAIVPFKVKGQGKLATLIIEYRGFLELAYRANPELTIQAGTVYENDDYTLVEGLRPELKIHERHWEKGAEPGEPLFFWCAPAQPGKEFAPTVISASEARRIGRASKAGMKPGTPWHDHFERMGEKTAIRRASRFFQLDPYKPASRKFAEALQADERTDELQYDELFEANVIDQEPDPADPLSPGKHQLGEQDKSRQNQAKLALKAALVHRAKALKTTVPTLQKMVMNDKDLEQLTEQEIGLIVDTLNNMKSLDNDAPLLP